MINYLMKLMMTILDLVLKKLFFTIKFKNKMALNFTYILKNSQKNNKLKIKIYGILKFYSIM